MQNDYLKQCVRLPPFFAAKVKAFNPRHFALPKKRFLFTYSFCLKKKTQVNKRRMLNAHFFTFLWKYDGCKRKCLTFIRHKWTTWTHSTLALDVVHPRHTTTWIYHAHSPDWAGDVRNKGGQTKRDWTFSSKTWGTHPPHP